MSPMTAWTLLLVPFSVLWTNPSAEVFETLVDAWIVCPGRRTITRLIGCTPQAARYHRWFRAAPWSGERFWTILWATVVRT